MMNLRLLFPVVLAAAAFGNDALAQVPQVVQLPTFRHFSVSTTVSVPDRGTAFLGGVDRARYGSVSRGIPLVSRVPGAGRLATNRAIGSSLSSSRASVTATIIDHAEHDRRLLAEAAASRSKPHGASATERKAAFLSKHIARRKPDTALSLGPSSRTNATRASDDRVQDAERQHEARMQAYLARGRRAEEAGRFGAARCSYHVVARRGNDQQQLTARMRLAAIESRDKTAGLVADGE